MVILDTTIITTSLPTMAAGFGVSVVDFSIGVSAYLLAIAAFVPPSGWLADRFGARRIFLFSIILFSFASILCAQSESLETFIFARVLQGVGGALMTPVGRLMILQLTSKNEISRAMTILTWPAMSAPVLGPVLGGFITTYFGWRWNFYINLPFGLLVFILALRYIPVLPKGERRPFDFLGFFLCGGAVIGVLYGLESFAHGWSSTVLSSALLLSGCVFSYLSIKHLQSAKSPLFTLGPISIKTFSLATYRAGTFVRVGLTATPFVLPLFLQVAFDLTPLEAGGYVMVYFVGNLVTKTVSPQILAKYGFRKLLMANGTLCSISIALMAVVLPLQNELTLVLLFVSGVFRSLQFASVNSLTFADIEGPARSSAATLSTLSMHISSALAVALSVVVLHASRVINHRTDLALLDFQLTMFALAILVAVMSLRFFKLSPSDGLAVSAYHK